MTVRPTEVLWISVPKVPATVTLEMPIGVAAVVAIVSVEFTGVTAGTTEAATKLQLEPKGRPPEHVSVTWLLNPFSALTATV